MKKIVFLSVVSLLTLAACSTKQEMDSEAVVPDSYLHTLTAIMEGNPQSKTVLDEDLIHVLWSPEDKINLFFQDKNECFTSTNDENTPIAKFQGHMSIDIVTGGNEDGDMDNSYFWGLYPYSESAIFSEDDSYLPYPFNGYVETELPAFQTAEKNSFADDLFITIGRSTSWSMPFYNVCSGLRFTVDQEGITSITLRSNNEYALAGRFRAGFDPETERPVILDVIDRYPEITIVPPQDQPWFYPDTYYYIVTLPGWYEEGITIELNGLPLPASITSTSGVSFKRSRFLTTNLTADKYYAENLPLERIDLNIENEGVRLYLDEVDYSEDPSYSQSYISDYTSLGEDNPLPVVFNWKYSDGTRTLTVSDPDTEEIIYEGDASGSTTEIYNLIPGKKYTYSVRGDIAWTSSFTPEGSLRLMHVEGVRNVRDLGGWKAGDYTIKYGRVYRGAQLNGISDTGRDAVLNTMKVAADIDLRGASTNPLELESYYPYSVTMFAITGNSGALYIKAIRQIIQLLEQYQFDERAVYFHCIYGADRTGTLAFLIEALLGVSESDLSKDFELTSFYELRARNGSSRYSIINQLIPTISNYEGENMQEKVTTWALEGGIYPEEIETLKTLLLEGYGE